MAHCPFRRLDPTRGSVLVDLGAWHFWVFSEDRVSWSDSWATFCGISSTSPRSGTGGAEVGKIAESWAGYLDASSEGCSSVESDWDCWGDLTMALVTWL